MYEKMYSPYTDIHCKYYINDTNSRVYTNNGLSLVPFDLSSIYNSLKFMDFRNLFWVLPITIVAAFSTSTPVRPQKLLEHTWRPQRSWSSAIVVHLPAWNSPV